MNTVVLLAAALAVGAPALKEKPRPALADVVGEWQVESSTINGRQGKIAGNLVYVFTKDGKWLIQRDGKETPTSLDRRFESDPKADPPTMDLITDAAAPATRLKGIFQIDGDTLKICGTRGKDERPKEFEAPEGSGNTLYVLKRVKK